MKDLKSFVEGSLIGEGGLLKYLLIGIGLLAIGGIFFYKFQPFRSKEFSGVPLRSPKPAPDFTLIHQNGERRTLSHLRGKAVALSFVYIDCPVVCPTIVANLKQGEEELGKHSKDVAFVLISVDPEHDTPEAFKKYADQMGGIEHWLLLTGSQEELSAAWRDYGILVEKRPLEGANPPEPASHGGHKGYTIVHTAKVVLIDRKGVMRVVWPGYLFPPEKLAHDIRNLI